MITLTSVLSFTFAALAMTPVFAAQVTYTLDPDHTQVRFTWNHLGFSNPGASFDVVTGTLVWDEGDPTRSSVGVSMPVDSVHTQVPKLDEDFKSRKFFDAANYPNVTFRSRKVERGDGPRKLKVTGEPTAHGVTRPVVLDVVVNKIGQRPMIKAPALGFDATTAFNRSDFGVTAVLPPLVSDEIQVHITTEAVEAGAFAETMKAAGAASSR